MKPYQVFVSDWRAAHAKLRALMEEKLRAGLARVVRLRQDGQVYEVWG